MKDVCSEVHYIYMRVLQPIREEGGAEQAVIYQYDSINTVQFQKLN